MKLFHRLHLLVVRSGARRSQKYLYKVFPNLSFRYVLTTGKSGVLALLLIALAIFPPFSGNKYLDTILISRPLVHFLFNSSNIQVEFSTFLKKTSSYNYFILYQHR